LRIGEDFVVVLTDELGRRTQTPVKVGHGNGSYPSPSPA